MRKLILLPIFIFSTVLAMAQTVDDVTLVVSGDGATKEAATHVALRSAIEQAYGVFVSANTEILNDELVKDEIATVASGNVKSYTELSATVLPNGNHLVSLQATVSTKSLATYAQSKGASCEFAGATFGANLKMVELNQKNTKIAFENLVKQLESFKPFVYDMYERKLEVSQPNAEGEMYFKVSLFTTEIWWDYQEMILSTLNALNMSSGELQNLTQLRVKYYTYPSYINTIDGYDTYLGRPTGSSKSVTYNFYSPLPSNMHEIPVLARTAFYIEDNLGDCHSIIPSQDGFKKEYYDIWNDDYYNTLSCGAFTKTNLGGFVTFKKTKKNKGIAPAIFAGEAGFLLTYDIERLTKISKFEIKRLPEKYYDDPGTIILDDTYSEQCERKALERISSYSELEKYLSENKPFIFCPERFTLRVDNFTGTPKYNNRPQLPILCKLAKEYEGRIFVGRGDIKEVDRSDSRANIWDDKQFVELVREWCVNMNGYVHYDNYDYFNMPTSSGWKTVYNNDAVFFFAKGKIVDVLNLEDCNEAVFRHWIETETQAPEELITKKNNGTTIIKDDNKTHIIYNW
jgi:hypothetical protein